MIFETERLEIKKLTLDDLDDFYRLHNDEEVMGKIPAPVLSLEESRAKLISIKNAYEVDGHRLRVWGAFLKQTGQFVGVCASIGQSERCRDIGYRLVREHWGQGLGTELTAGLISELELDPSITLLTACVDRDNIASIKILEKYMTCVKEEYDADTGGYERHYQRVK